MNQPLRAAIRKVLVNYLATYDEKTDEICTLLEAEIAKARGDEVIKCDSHVKAVLECEDIRN